jgi:uncharacterized protein (DUF952 family)
MGRSLLVLTPAGVEATEVWRQLRAELWHRDFSFSEVFLPELRQDQLPFINLSEALGINGSAKKSTVPTLTHLIEAADTPDIVYLEGLDELDESGRDAWLNFLSQWTQSSQSIADRGDLPKKICLVTPAATILTQLPQTSVHLAIQWWWFFPSALDTRLLCRLGSDGNDSEPLNRWREYVLPALAGGDMTLMSYLWDDVDQDFDYLLKRIRSFASERAWTYELLESWGAIDFSNHSGHDPVKYDAAPPERWRNLWAHGAISWTPEYGPELHVAAMAVLEQTEEVQHRLWRGQAELLLPLIDQVRLKLCSILTYQHGDDWPIRWHLPANPEELKEVKESPLATQWGYLEWLLRKCRQLVAHQSWLPLVSLGRWIRNEIAHYRPIEFHDFENFWSETKKL